MTAADDDAVPAGGCDDGRATVPACGSDDGPGPGRAAPSAPVRVLPAGREALLVELDSAEAAEAFHAEVVHRRARGELPAVREVVPGARTVLLDGLADSSDAGRKRFARTLESWTVGALRRADGPEAEIPVVYDGPDLAEVAGMWGVRPEEVAAIHSGTAFRVAFCGFAPGFGYLTGLPERLHVPRRATPRTRVPAGAVALAGPYTGVYPRPSPGGWQLVGRMEDPARLWDPAREPAALLAPGTRVRFVPTGARG